MLLVLSFSPGLLQAPSHSAIPKCESWQNVGQETKHVLLGSAVKILAGVFRVWRKRKLGGRRERVREARGKRLSRLKNLSEVKELLEREA